MTRPTGSLGLELGADDYVTKPFSPRELALRVAVGAAARRLAARRRAACCTTATSSSTWPPARHGGGTFAGPDGRASSTCSSFLLQHPGEAFDRTALLSQVWGWSFGDATTVTVHVRRLREKVEADPALSAPGHHRVGHRLPLRTQRERKPVTVNGADAAQITAAAAVAAIVVSGLGVVLLRLSRRGRSRPRSPSWR